MFKPSYKARYIAGVLRSRAWQRASMRLLNWGSRMPSSKHYNLVPNDEFDTRIPLHPDEAFHYGITFAAKYIGSMEVPRPSSRVEIVAAMRRVRYEFKAKGAKKRKVTVEVSIEGVRVTTRKKKSKEKKKKSSKLFGENSSGAGAGTELMHHPIYRIFYVSHDSSDLKIFSYIARDGATNAFRCNVFKSNKKSQAMRIVRTVGQAFEVCHKMQSEQHEAGASTSSVLDEPLPSDRASDQHAFKETPTECDASESGAASSRAPAELVSEEEPLRPKNLELLPPPPRKEGKRSPQPRPIPAATLELPECVTKAELSGPQTDEASTPLSAQHQLQLLRERLEQQAQQTRAAVAQLLLLRDQLAAEQAARCEAQTRTHQLLVHNKELLEHIAALVAHLQDRERGVTRPISAHQLTLLPQLARRGGGKDANSNGGFNGFNGAASPRHGDSLSDIIAQSNNLTQNLENNNVRISPGTTSLFDEPTTPVSFGDMTNEQIQNYLISKFQTTMPKTEPKPSVNYNQQFFQNSNAFPNIPPLTNHFSSTDVNSLLKHTAWSDGHGSQASSLAASKESTPERGEDGALFIMPLSHSGTLTAQSEDGRVKLIVPVSPSGSVADMAASPGTSASGGPSLRVPAYAPAASGNSLRVPGSTIQPGPITRTTSEKVPNRSEMMAALRSQWTRHTTK